MYTSIQTSLNAGELSPSLFGRVDLKKYKEGCSTLRNFFVSYRGGVSSRAGLAYVLKCKQAASATSLPPRLIPFQFNINQQYALEFGDQYMRIVYRGGYVTETVKNITGATQTNPAVITSAAHGYSSGDWIYITNMEGMTNFNSLTWIVNTATTNTFTLTDLFGNIVDSTLFNAYTSGGTAARIYTVVSPYAAVDLPFLKYTQSADTMSITCVNQQTQTEYPPYDLVRSGNTNWAFNLTTFTSSIVAPTGLVATATNSTTKDTWYSYVVTAIDKTTGNESVASNVTYVENNDIAINAGSNSLVWNAVSNAAYYYIYSSIPSYSVDVPVGVNYGYLGQAFGTQFTDTNIVPDLTKTPPLHLNPFARGAIASVNITSGGSGYNQATVGYAITTSTGSGFAGTPIVSSGSIVGFIVSNGGAGYVNTDTITINGSGATAATGSYTFSSNPTNGQNIILNGVTWTFVTSGATGTQTNIQSTVQATVYQLITDLTNSGNSSINAARYNATSLMLNITYGTTGTVGNTYTLAPGTYGGTPSGGTLTGGAAIGGASATATLTVGPQTGTYPGTVSYFQQRRVYGYSLNQPNTYWMSQPGSPYTNFDAAVPTQDGDSITGSPWAQQVNGIQFFQAMPSGLITLTGNGAWLVTGGNNAAITPADQNAAAQAYNGCHFQIQPIVSNYDILYVQAKGSIVRDLSYNFFTAVYTGTDTTVLSNHLFNFHQLQQWCYAEEPFKIIWAVRDDGIMLSLTWLKEQEVYGWARHDTNGLFVSVTSITEPPVDAVYVITKRYIEGQNQWVYYTERMDNRNWQNVSDCYCIDAGLSYPLTYPNATLTPAGASGTSNISAVNIVDGGFGYTSPVIVAVDSVGGGNGATFSAVLTSGVITGVTVLTSGSGYTPGFTTLTVSDSTGSDAILASAITNNVLFTADSSVFNSGMIGDILRIGNNNNPPSFTSAIATNGGGTATITSYISGTEIMADITQPITNIIPNNPQNMPVPVAPNEWSIGTPTTTVSGLNHLEGMMVTILGDGSVFANQTVVNGMVTLETACSQIVVGLAYLPQVQTLYLDPKDQSGSETTQGKRKLIYAVTARVENSRGFSLGCNQPDSSTQPNEAAPNWINMTEIKEAPLTLGQPIELTTGDFFSNISGDWDIPTQIALEQQYPLPVNLLALIPWVEVGDTSG